MLNDSEFVTETVGKLYLSLVAQRQQVDQLKEKLKKAAQAPASSEALRDAAQGCEECESLRVQIAEDQLKNAKLVNDLAEARKKTEESNQAVECASARITELEKQVSKASQGNSASELPAAIIERDELRRKFAELHAAAGVAYRHARRAEKNWDDDPDKCLRSLMSAIAKLEPFANGA